MAAPTDGRAEDDPEDDEAVDDAVCGTDAADFAVVAEIALALERRAGDDDEGGCAKGLT